jgi:hypothetical protein
VNLTREAAAFDRQVDRWVCNAALGGVESFDDLVRVLPGVYPSVVAESLDRLLRAGAISVSIHGTVTQRAMPRPQRASGPSSLVLPPSHPLDFDWRYAPKAIDELLARVLSVTEPRDTVALLGTPSLYLTASQRGIDRRFTLIDDSSVTLDRLAGVGDSARLYHRDVILDPVPELSAAAVVADPPWYPEYIEAFLWAAASSARRGARLFMSMPGIGTRPGGRRERADFRRCAAVHGLRVLTTAPATLAYLSPPFEINALAAAGWHDLPMDRRRGDLVVLEATGKPQSRPEWASGPPLWHERRLGWVRIRVRNEPDRIVDPSLTRVGDGDVLDGVSRRHPLRERVAVWTSGNRVYGCASPRLLLAAIDALTLGEDPHDRVATELGRSLSRQERGRVRRAANQVSWIARVETRELARLGWTPEAAAAERVAS